MGFRRSLESLTGGLLALVLVACSGSEGGGGGSGASAGQGGGSSGSGGGGGQSGSGGGSGGSTATPPERPPAGSCQIDDPAFCETFETEHPGGLSGPLDEAVWGISRWSHDLGNVFVFAPASTDKSFDPPATFCGKDFSNLLGLDTFAVCDGVDVAGNPSKQLHEVFHDTGDFAFHSLLIRQPFDFGGRTGTIALDVDAKFNPHNVGHGWWIEVWVVEDPVPLPYHGAPAVQSFPRNGVGFAFEGFNCDKGAWQNSLTKAFVSKDYQVLHEYGGSGECYQSADAVQNHMEIRLSQDKAEIWVSDAGKPETFRKIADVDNLDVPFSRGYVVVQHSQYNAAKDDGTPSQTFRWDNIGFDGPSLPRVRGYKVPDATDQGGEKFGWHVGDTPESFEVDGVDLADAKSALFNFSYWPFDDNAAFDFRINGGSWHTFEPPDHPDGYSLHSYSVPVDLAELSAGKNTLELKYAGGDLPVGNLDLTVVP